jgi:excisionase family DNA binding protein
MEKKLGLKHISPINKENSASRRVKRLPNEAMKLSPEKIDRIEHLANSIEKRALSLKEAAQMLNVSVGTVRRAVKSGSINAFQFTKAGNYRIPIEEIEKFIGGKLK